MVILIIGIMLVLSLTACDDGSTGLAVIETDGRLTITNIRWGQDGEYNANGNYMVGGNDNLLVAAGVYSDDNHVQGGKIANETVTLNVYRRWSGTEANYTGSETVSLTLHIFDHQKIHFDADTPYAPRTLTVTFTNGIGNVQFYN